jgi:WD40 repeat protein
MKRPIRLISQFAMSNSFMNTVSIAIVLLLLTIALDCRSDKPSIPTAISPSGSPLGLRTPFWSKDGSQIIGLGHTFGIDGDDFYQVDAAGGMARRLFHDSLEKDLPALSPDGNRIAYLAAPMGRIYSRAHVWVIDTDGGNARDLTPSGGNWENVRWSPDSKYLVFDGLVEDSGALNYQIVLADVRSAETRLLTRSSTYGCRDPGFLPGGNRIVYTSGRTRADYGGKVFVSDSFADLSFTGAVHSTPIDTTPASSMSARPSPVRNTIYFYWGIGGEAGAGVYGLDLDAVGIPASPSSFVYLYRGDYFNLAQWSPKGELLLHLEGTPKSDLYILNRQNKTEQRLTTGLSVRLFSYAWSADSKRLVFSASDGASGSINTFTYNLETNALRKLTITHN